MKQFRVRFYYGTDLRLDWQGVSLNEMTALARAFDESRLTTGWVYANGTYTSGIGDKNLHIVIDNVWSKL